MEYRDGRTVLVCDVIRLRRKHELNVVPSADRPDVSSAEFLPRLPIYLNVRDTVPVARFEVPERLRGLAARRLRHDEQ